MKENAVEPVRLRLTPILKMLGVTALVVLSIVAIYVYYKWLDSWVLASLVHIPQFLIPFLIICYVTRGRLREYGFNLKQTPPTFTHKRMAIVGAIFGFLLSLRYIPQIVGNVPLDIPQPVTAVSIAGNMTFQWIIVGLCEETMFRGMIQTYLMKNLEGHVKILGQYLHIGTVLAAIFWGGFHFIEILNMPVSNTVFLVLLTTAIGLLMGYAYQKTGSLLTTIIVHNTLFGVHLIVGYIIYSLL
jgi:membrane protease YdiL (CAAX protease family)